MGDLNSQEDSDSLRSEVVSPHYLVRRTLGLNGVSLEMGITVVGKIQHIENHIGNQMRHLFDPNCRARKMPNFLSGLPCLSVHLCGRLSLNYILNIN